MRVLVASVGLILTCVAETAHAQSERQPWLADRRFEGGAGVRSGSFELHPGVAGELGYDSNFFQSAGITAADGVIVIDPRLDRGDGHVQRAHRRHISPAGDPFAHAAHDR